MYSNAGQLRGAWSGRGRHWPSGPSEGSLGGFAERRQGERPGGQHGSGEAERGQGGVRRSSGAALASQRGGLPALLRKRPMTRASQGRRRGRRRQGRSEHGRRRHSSGRSGRRGGGQVIAFRLRPHAPACLCYGGGSGGKGRGRGLGGVAALLVGAVGLRLHPVEGGLVEVVLQRAALQHPLHKPGSVPDLDERLGHDACLHPPSAIH
mmetsp:Transcript_53258/g.111090  ORF Transcript_53258/g.111090 Transcript_53258/m.111090 type:complete len:208 (-) Transcript_53258:496-1119(-)